MNDPANSTTSVSWKQRLYDAYVSSGQAGNSVSQKALLHARAPSIRALIARHMPADKSVRIVDLGCGYGPCLHFLKQSGYRNIQGFDGSAEQVELAHRLGIQEIEQQDIHSYLENAAPESIDVVLLMDVLEHLEMQELFDTLDNVHRILRTGGRVIAHVPNAEGVFGMRIRYGDLTHENAFTPKSAQQLFATIGFTHVSCFEDRPIVHGVVSAIRRAIWELGTLSFRLLLAAETGQTSFVLSQNMLIVADK